MDVQFIKNSLASTPAFVVDAEEVIETLTRLAGLRNTSGCKVLYSIKALPFSTVLELAKPWIDGFSVSSLFEARLAGEILAGEGSIHLTTPGIRPDEMEELSRLCTHISFNSLSQHQRFAEAAKAQTSVGLRLNPGLSFLDDDRFDPCRPHSKLGVGMEALSQTSGLEPIAGLHIHNIFSALDFAPLIQTIEKLRPHLDIKPTQLDWLNLGGGYLFNQIEDLSPFIELVRMLKDDFAIDVYIEPGKAVVGQAGYLVTTVIDSFSSDGKHIVILDTSVNHHPEVFEYQRQPALHEHDPQGHYSAVLAGSTCLAGDIFGEYRFNHALNIGDKLVFKHVGAYSLIKANRFNGYNLPDIYCWQERQIKKLKHYTYQDYRRQWLAD